MFAVLLTGWILARFDSTATVAWAFPSAYESKLLVSAEPLRVIAGLAGLIGWGAIMVAGAAAIVSRRDI
jgi:hypothetical protein